MRRPKTDISERGREKGKWDQVLETIYLYFAMYNAFFLPKFLREK